MTVIGKTIGGKYRILSRVDGGGFATMNRAQDLCSGETAVVEDTLVETCGSMDPAINLLGVTVLGGHRER